MEYCWAKKCLNEEMALKVHKNNSNWYFSGNIELWVKGIVDNDIELVFKGWYWKKALLHLLMVKCYQFVMNTWIRCFHSHYYFIYVTNNNNVNNDSVVVAEIVFNSNNVL